MEIPDKEVCMGTTGHAEVVQGNFDPAVIALDEMLDVFFAIHDPTTLDRQGNDVGSQYRSAIFYRSPEQKATAEKKIRAVAVMAEDYHQEYFRLNGHQPYYQFVVSPKVSNLRKRFAAKRKAA